MKKHHKNIEKELRAYGIEPSDLVSPSRRSFIVKALLNSTTAVSVYRLGLIAAFLKLNPRARAQFIPAGFWKKSDSGSPPVTLQPGTAWSWGANNKGQLGVNSTVDHSVPVQVAGSWLQLAGGRCSFGIKEDYTLWGWGANKLYGELGIGATSDYETSPVQIAGSWIQISQSTSGHALAIRSNNTLWAWGNSEKGVLGANIGDQSSPVQIDGSWIQVSATHNLSFGIRTDNTLWAWGSNKYGQLGNGTSGGSQSSPVQVAGSWKQVSGGYKFAAGVKVDGTLWSWGKNSSIGVLGNGSTENQSQPVQVVGSWLMVSAGQSRMHAIQSDNTLWSWGNNASGSLGLGLDPVGNDTSVPVQVSGFWKNVVSGPGHSLAIKPDNTLWTWGEAGLGRLGDGTIVDKSAPVQISGSWLQIAAGSSHSIAIKSV